MGLRVSEIDKQLSLNFVQLIVTDCATVVDFIDPSNVWRDARGNYHAVFHDHMMIGGHAYSSDGVVWDYSPSPCFGPNVDFLAAGAADSIAGGGGSTTETIETVETTETVWLSRRERPHCVIDDRTGRPIALSSGVQESGGPVPEWARQKGLGSDRTYTLVVPVGPAE